MVVLRGRALLTAVTVLTSLGFMLIGYDNGLMGGFAFTAPFLDTFGIDKNSWNGQLVGFIVSMYEIGCFVGAVSSSLFGDKLGRRRSILLGVCIMIVGSILMSSSFHVAQILIARFVIGYGMGIVNSTVPVMQAEFSPKSNRGLFVCMQLSTLNFGIMLVYWMNYAFNKHADGANTSYVWRVPTIMQVIFLCPMIVIILLIPDTPRWLASRDRNEESLQVLEQLYEGRLPQEEIQKMHSNIVATVAFETAAGAGQWSELLKKDAIHTRRRFFIACGIQIMQQMGGINALIYYAQFIFSESLNFSDSTASLISGLLNTWFFAASFIPWLLIDRLGRRKLLLGSIFVMASVMVVQAALVYQIQFETAIAYSAGIGAAAMLFVFQGAFTIGFQATVWVYPSEILPLKIRQKGSSISTASNWICNFLIVYITPVMKNNIGWRMYIPFAAMNFAWLPIIYLFFPETKGLALEDVDRLFCEDIPLAFSGPEKEGLGDAVHQHVETTKV